MVLFEGNYSGVLEPGRHFIVLEKDFSNFGEVLARLKDHAGLQQMADRTYNEVALNPRWSYPAFIEIVDRAVEQEVESRHTAPAQRAYSTPEFDRAVRLSLSYYLRRRAALALQSIVLGMPLARRAIFGLWYALPRPVQQLVRPLARAISR
jgi:hypothetical protein